jgi:hypothetical protein
MEPFEVCKIKPHTPGIKWSTDKGSTSIESIENFFELSKMEILRGIQYSSPLLLHISPFLFL